MRWGNLSLLVYFLASVVSGAEKMKADQPSPHMTLKEKLKYKVNANTTAVLPPGVGLCKKGLRSDQCSIIYRGGKGLSEVTSDSIVERLEKRGWRKTKKLPRHKNSVHICCRRKMFGMETDEDVDGGEEGGKGNEENVQMSATESKTKETKEKSKTVASSPIPITDRENPDDRQNTAKKTTTETTKETERRSKQTDPEHPENKDKKAQRETIKTKETKWQTESGMKEKHSEKTEMEAREDKTVNSENKSNKEEETPKEPELPATTTDNLDKDKKKVHDQYLEGKELIDESEVW